jgi:hypothetical protein
MAAPDCEALEPELGEAITSEVELHLDGCPRCRRALASHQALLGAMASLPSIPPLVSQRASVLSAAALILQGGTPVPRPGRWKFGSISDAPSAASPVAFQQNLASTRPPERDVRAHVLHAAAAAAAGIAPPSVERFKNVPSSASSPPAHSGREPEQRRRWLPLALVGFVVFVAAGVTALTWSDEPSVVESAPDASFITPPAPPPLVTVKVTSEVVPPEIFRPAVAPLPTPVVTSVEFDAGVLVEVPQAPRITVDFLIRQLRDADPRARAQAAFVIALGRYPDAFGPLCEALDDPEPIVRMAVVRALRNWPVAGFSCLRAHHDPLPQVQRQIDAVLLVDTLRTQSPAFALAYIEPGTSDALSLEQAALGKELLRENLLRHKIRPIETEDGGSDLPTYSLQLTLIALNASSWKFELLVMRLPAHQPLGSWTVKVSGSKPESRLKAAISRLVDDAARDLEWGK